MIRVHRNLYDAQEKGKEEKIETHEVEPKQTVVEPARSVQESEAEKPVKGGKKRKKAKKEEV